MSDRLSTGIEILDRKLEGGIPPGRVVVLSASPASQSELFLYDLASVRPTVYLTTERSSAAVTDTLEVAGVPLENVVVHRIGDGQPLTDARQAIEELPAAANCIVDPVAVLERQSAAEYRAFLNDLKSRTVETGSLAVLHCLEGRRVADLRDVTEYVADIVFDLSKEVQSDAIEYTLAVPKFRGGTALEETIKLHLAADVSVDVSRKIA